MTINEIAVLLDAKISQDVFNDVPVTGAYTSDLLSDVMAHAREGGALITIQAHKNTVAVATLVNVSCIIICNNRPLPADMLAAAAEERIAVLVTGENQFSVSGRLWEFLGKK
ncbi:MAG: hypothetical protein FWD78_15635 [Treponema sp.]|nr:hypothetical protein [Treponema sp.]